MSNRLHYGTHGVDPSGPGFPAFVNDDADAARDVTDLAKRLRTKAQALQMGQGDVTAADGLVEALFEAADRLDDAAAQVELRLDGMGYVVS